MPQLSALVSMNGFKGSLSNVEACEAVADGLRQAGIESRSIPVGDGGLGTRFAVQGTLGGAVESFASSGPLAKKTPATVLCLPDANRPRALYIESADTCGHHLVTPAERDPLRASSYGLGAVLHQALQRWGKSLERVYIGLGDSAVSDMGMGMLCALGFQFFDDSGHQLWGNATGLRHIRSWKAPATESWQGIKFTVLCDVLNPVCGPHGSARVFAPQKGANSGQVNMIEAGMENFARLIEANDGRNLRLEPMTGSAGGLGTALLAFLNGELVHGAKFLLDWIGFDRILSSHRLLVTGEGRTDAQTLAGKAPLECLHRAAQQGKWGVVISGALGAGHEALARQAFVAGLYACGSDPSARDALTRKTYELFSNATLLADVELAPAHLEVDPSYNAKPIEDD